MTMNRRRKDDVARLADYVEGFFKKHKKTEWPTVAGAARALGWKQSRGQVTCDNDPRDLLFLSAYFTEHEPKLGEHFVVRLEERPKIEIIRGASGLSVYLCGHRIAGDKPWGGGQLVAAFDCDLGDVKKAIGDACKQRTEGA